MAVVLGAIVASSSASAQATRTWVSGVGDDVNPCSRTAPCKTFAGAISKTADGGEINCLDPGGYGAVTITKSMTISCPYTEGGALAGGNGIVVNDSATATPGTAVVFLRGLDIFGVNPASNGVRFISGAALHIEESTIRRFNATNSFGISFQPSSPALLFISHTTIASNGSGTTGGGILVQPTGAAGTARLSIDNTKLVGNSGTGIRVDTAGTTGPGVAITMDGGSLVGSQRGLSINAFPGASASAVLLSGVTVSNNSVAGIETNGANAIVRVNNSTVIGNGTGISVNSSSTIATFGNNRVYGNSDNGAFNQVLTAQ
ncbi:MAG: right-handed parallel beta-helix repeat-containing protein [Pseudomonadota bacterium]